MTVKKLCVITGTRAEYGLLKHLMRVIQEAPDFQLQLVVAAAHLLAQFGHTQSEILDDGFVPDAQVDMLLANNSSLGIAKSTALGLLGFADAFDRLRPDMVIILGDRFEALAAAQAAFLQSIPIAHLHGGELTLGALDDSIRHAITKLSSLHFVAHEDYARRVRQLGEEDWRVQVVGPLIADALLYLSWLSRSELADDLKLDTRKQWVLLTYHPETLGTEDDIAAVDALYQALSQQLPDAHYIWTYPNADAGGERILNWLLSKAASDQRIKAVSSLGQRRYLSVMKESIAVVGNSSSGVLEAPLLSIPSINIGSRQVGRLRDASVNDCDANVDDIAACLRNIVAVAPKKNYLGASPSLLILDRLRNLEFNKLPLKGFTDRECV